MAAIRDPQANFIAAKAMNIGIASNVTAELVAIREGLQLAISLNLTRIIISTDLCCVFQPKPSNVHKHLVQDIQLLSVIGKLIWWRMNSQRSL